MTTEISLMRFVTPILGALAAAVLCLAGCTYPAQTIEQGTPNGHLSFVGAPPGTRVIIDGSDLGTTDYFDGIKHVLDVAPGTHRVVATSGGQIIYDHQVYVGSDAKLSVRVR